LDYRWGIFSSIFKKVFTCSSTLEYFRVEINSSWAKFEERASDWIMSSDLAVKVLVKIYKNQNNELFDFTVINNDIRTIDIC